MSSSSFHCHVSTDVQWQVQDHFQGNLLDMITDKKDDINFLWADECQQMQNVANLKVFQIHKGNSHHVFNHYMQSSSSVHAASMFTTSVSAVRHEEQNVCSLEGWFCFFSPHINDVWVIFNLHNFLLYMFFMALYFTVGSWLELFPSFESWSKVHCIQEVFHQTDTASLINRLHLAWASILLPTNTEMKSWGLALSYK